MSSPKRTDDIRRQNTRLTLQALRARSALSRTHITEQTGLSAATVSTISARLLQKNILQNTADPAVDSAKNRRGRPQAALSLNPRAGCIVVMSFAFNRLSAKVLDYTGACCASAESTVNTLQLSEADLSYTLTRMVNNLISRGSTPDMPLRYIALGIQGVVDASGETLLWSPITPLKRLRLRQLFQQAFGVPVWIGNDCNMMVEALRWQYPERFAEDFAVLLMAQGIGMGLMLRGQRFIGRQSSAGEFGHMVYQPEGAPCRCGQSGCIEAYAGDYAIWRRAQQSTAAQATTVSLDAFEAAAFDAVLADALQGESIARQAFREAGQALGHGLRSLFALIDPIPVAFVGRGTLAFELLEPEIRRVISQNSKMLNGEHVAFSCFSDAETLILQGCSVIALRALDDQFSQVEA